MKKNSIRLLKLCKDISYFLLNQKGNRTNYFYRKQDCRIFSKKVEVLMYSKKKKEK